MVFLLVQKRKQPALIASVSFLLLHGGIAVFYGYAMIGDKHLHDWLVAHKMKNDIICFFCHYSYGLGYYVLLIRPWIMSLQLPYILGRGIQSKIK